jgi:hypothetical protein
VLNFSTNHALVDQLIVEPSLDLSLSHGDFLDVSCDKDELCGTTSVLHASAENKHLMHVASEYDELHFLSSLHTLCYIEFDDLCNLECLEERLFAYADFPWLSRHSYHVIGKYNNKGQHMVHRVTSRDVVINNVPLTSPKAPKWSQVVICDAFVSILIWSQNWRHICASVTK